MNPTYLLLLWLLFIANTPLQAQFSYNSRQGRAISKKSTSTTNSVDTLYNQEYGNFHRTIRPTPFLLNDVLLDIDAQSDAETSIRTRSEIDTLIRYTSPLYLRLNHRKNRKKKNFVIRDSSNRVLYNLHQHYISKKPIVWDRYVETNFRTSKSLSTQGLAGLQGIANNFSLDDAGALLELGGRISNMRLTLPTKTTFVERVSNDTFYLTTLQKDRYLYLDFISRGVLATDSLKATISEYINTTMGSPLSLRVNFQHNFNRPYHVRPITGKREPNFYFNLSVDARAVPVFGTSSMEGLGGSIHVIPSLLMVLPSGAIDSKAQEDNFIVQLTVNSALVSDNIQEIMLTDPDQSAIPVIRNMALSFELRVGNYSELNPTRNWSFFIKWVPLEIVGQQFAVGYTFAPQAVKDQ